jgi:hypothetical protein
MARFICALVLTSSAAAFLLGGCNAVLGIEEAHLRSDGSGGSSTNSSRVRIPPATCNEPTSACRDCVGGTELNDCLANIPCRERLDDYRACLGAGCKDPEGLCWAELTSTNDNLSFFLENDCADRCLGSPIVSTCDLYCACMPVNCSTALGGADCMAECTNNLSKDLTVLSCRLGHCQVAGIHPEEGHCDHAVGKLGFCPSRDVRNTCTDKSQSNFACEKPSDCCSGQCDGNICQ